MSKIIMLKVAVQNEVHEYRVGEKIDPLGEFLGKQEVAEKTITKIENTSFSQYNELGDNIYNERHAIYVNGKLYRVINGIATITEYDIDYKPQQLISTEIDYIDGEEELKTLDGRSIQPYKGPYLD